MVVVQRRSRPFLIMKLPNAQAAVVGIEKLRDYCLNPEHPRGKNKARVFAAALGLTANDAEWLRQAILAAARVTNARASPGDGYGERYVLDFVCQTLERSATVRTTWIVRRGERIPRLTSCYVL